MLVDGISVGMQHFVLMLCSLDATAELKTHAHCSYIVSAAAEELHALRPVCKNLKTLVANGHQDITDLKNQVSVLDSQVTCCNNKGAI